MDGFEISAFWGKARPIPNARCRWHPLVCHCLDVAAVGERLLDTQERALKRVARGLGWEPDALRRAVLFLLALHDIGKLSRPFQAKVEELWPGQHLGPMKNIPADPGHGAVGLWLAADLAPNLVEPVLEAWPRSSRRQLLAPFFGHHGRPVEDPRNAQMRLVMGSRGCDLACAFGVLMQSRFKPAPLPETDDMALARASWWLAGIAVLADWLGSWQEIFTYEPPPDSLDDYWDLARARAAEAVQRASIVPTPVASASDLEIIAGQGWQPSPVQAWAESVGLPEGPVCAFIEDMTGSGKTEAALVLAHRLMARGHVRGLYLALPTMATANAMFQRLKAAYRRLFETGHQPSLALAHGRAALHEGFRQAIEGLGGTASIRSDPEDDGEGDASNAACSAWLASESRRAFLADVGIGTIDQALLGVLPAKFQSLRLLGLSDRVLIVDEAHAYDAYMNEELARLLEFQAALGGSAIVLSATLPETVRGKLGAAFLRGLGERPPALAKAVYPRVTLLARAASEEAARSSRPELGRTLTIERLADAAATHADIVDAARRGAAVAWVRNTVDDAIEAAEALGADWHNVSLFHARMAMGDRLAVEEAIVRRFGKEGDAAGRAGIVVATQVIEQSLDLDFDLLVSDLAPVDLLLQRAGRLWRHMVERPRGKRPMPGPRLLVVSPDPSDTVSRGWFTDVFPRAGAVYEDHALLWKTARVLFDEKGGRVRVPEHVRDVIEAVYGNGALDEVPPGLERSASDAEGNRQAARAHAWANLLTVAKGYDGEHEGWQHDVRTPTRLGEETITLRLARIEDGQVVPWFAADDPRRAWALSETTVRRTKVSRVLEPDGVGLRAEIERAKGRWPKWEREAIPLLVLNRGEGSGWHATVEGRSGPLKIMYDVGFGLRFRS